MLKDITLGQYIPGDTVVHRLDPRTKIMLTMVYVIAIFFVNRLTSFLLMALFVGQILWTAKLSPKLIFKGIRALLIFVIFTAAINIYMTDGTRIPYLSFWIFNATYEGLYLAVIMALRLVFLVAGTSVLTYTTSPIVLTDGIEALLRPFRKIGVPSHEIAMMMTIAIRFIPTIIEETDKIMKAQSARGADFESGNLLQRAKAMIPLLVPLFISAFRRADELALAMECRGYRGGDKRTKMHQLKMHRCDYVAYLWSAVAFCIIIGSRWIPGIF